MDNPVCRAIDYRTAVCVALLCLATAASAQSANWKPYSYPSDGFQASFPSTPELRKQDVPTDSGSFVLDSYTAQVGSVVAFVAVCDYGSKATGQDQGELLQGAKEGVLINSNAQLMREKKIKLGVNPGLEFEGLGNSIQFTARLYLVGSMLYQTLVVTPVGKPYEDTARFLDSFQLIARTIHQGR
jgi:hypothetical protein